MEFDALNEEKYIIDDSIRWPSEVEAVLNESKPVFNMEQNPFMDNYIFRVLNGRVPELMCLKITRKFTLARTNVHNKSFLLTFRQKIY